MRAASNGRLAYCDCVLKKARTLYREFERTINLQPHTEIGTRPELRNGPSNSLFAERSKNWIPSSAMLAVIENCPDKDLLNLCLINRQWNSLVPKRRQLVALRPPSEKDDILITKMPFSRQIELQNLHNKVCYCTSLERLYHCIWYLNPQRLHINCAYADIQLKEWLPLTWLQKVPQIRIECINKRYDSLIDCQFNEELKEQVMRATILLKNVRSLKLTTDHLILNNSLNSLIIRWRRPKIRFRNKDIVKLLNYINTAEEFHLNVFLNDFDVSELEGALFSSKKA